MKLRVLALGVWLFAVVNGYAQTQTTGQISGVVADASGAVVPKAQIAIVSKDTGLKRTTESNTDGYYVAPLLDPGNYTITVSAPGLQTVSREGITVAVGHSALVDFKLEVGTLVEKVTVSTEPSLIEPSNPNTTTTFNATQLTNIPNPGNDLSYVANLAPGAIMNVSQGGGFVRAKSEFNGQPALANDFTIDGLDANDVGGSTNFAGASGLQLGLNAVQEVSVDTSPYSVGGGRTSGSHIDFVTKSGSNSFHGNLYEVWNGSAMNANDFFLNANGQPKSRSNVNEFGASLGGRVVKDKLFFFTDVEGIRLILPTVATTVLPSPGYESYVLQQLPLGGGLDFGFFPLPPQPAEVPLYKQMFSLIGDTSKGTPLAEFDCPLDATAPGAADGCANLRTFSLKPPPTNETLFTIKLNYNQSSRDSYWFRFQLNNGSQTQADSVNSAFNTIRSIPERRGTLGWTHIFNSNVVNQFNPGLSYTSNTVNPANAKTLSLFPMTLTSFGVFTDIGGLQYLGSGGSATTIWQLNDNLTWTAGKHSFQFGENLRRVLATVIDSSFVAPLVDACSLTEFTYGASCFTEQIFRTRGSEDRLANVNLDLYAMDTMRATSKLTVTVGLRVAWNSDPVSQSNQFSRLSGSFAAISHDVNQPPNQVVIPNQSKLWGSTPLLMWEPRTAIAYQFAPKTVLRAGFGVFTNPPDLYQLALNPPTADLVNAGFFSSLGPAGGIAIAPGVPGSVVDAAVAANQQFQQNFSTGGLSCASPMAPPNACILPFFFTARESGRHEYPYSMEWSTGIERELGRNAELSVKYVGTRSVKGAYQTDENAFQSLCQGCFAPLPFGTPLDRRFGHVVAYHSGANSSYHALQITGQKRMGHGLALQANYTYSHCLDMLSNAGSYFFGGNSRGYVFPTDNLKRYYGNCDYDVRHSLNGSYIYELPFHSGSAWLNHVLGGWQVSGTIFLRGGFPFSVNSRFAFNRFINASSGIFANTVPGQDPYSKSPIPGVTQPGRIQWLNPNAFQSVISPTGSCYPSNTPQDCQQGDLVRNSLRAPGFRWTDLSITKSFKVTERITFRFDTQLYNLFNHPNFGFPSAQAGIPGVPSFASSLVNFGTISQTVSPSTGLLGSGLGGDSSVRMIALRGRIEF